MVVGFCRVLQDEETEGWTETLAHYSYYPESQLRPIMCQLASLVLKANEKLGDSRAKRVVSVSFLRRSAKVKKKKNMPWNNNMGEWLNSFTRVQICLYILVLHGIINFFVFTGCSTEICDKEVSWHQRTAGAVRSGDN